MVTICLYFIVNSIGLAQCQMSLSFEKLHPCLKRPFGSVLWFFIMDIILLFSFRFEHVKNQHNMMIGNVKSLFQLLF